MNVKIEGLELDKLNPRGYGGMCSRETVVFREQPEIDFEKGLDTVATTEAAALVVDWERWEIVREVLPMRYCDLSGDDDTELLDAHSRVSVEKVKGRAFNWNIKGIELLCKIFISEAEPSIRQKVKERVIKRVSLGYQTDKNQTVEIPKKAEVIIDGQSYKNEYEDDIPLLVRTWWKKKELSLVPLGADEAAKIKRALENGIKAEDPEIQKLMNDIVNNQKSLEQKINSINITGGVMPDSTKTEKTPDQIKLLLLNEIDGTAEQYGDAGQKTAAEFRKKIRAMENLTEEESTKTVKDFYKAVSDAIIIKGGQANKPFNLGMNADELKTYSPAKAVQGILKGERKGLEFEIHQDLERLTGQSSSDRGILIPSDVQTKNLRELTGLNKRAHSTTATEGGDLITDEFQAGMLKEVVRNQTVLGQAGITIITGLRGTFQLPKITSGLTIYSVAENNAATTAYIVTDIESVSPKNLSGNTVYGRQLFFQTDAALPGFDQILMRDLYNAMNVKYDYEGINGTNLSNRVNGLLNQSNVIAPSLSTIDLRHIVNVIRRVAKQNGLKDNMKWLSSVDVECLLRTTPVFPTGHTDKTLYENGQIESYQSLSSNQVPDSYEIFGNWPEFYGLNWGVEELIVAEQPQHKEWLVEISLHRLVNFFLRSPESFAIADDVPVSAWDDIDA